MNAAATNQAADSGAPTAEGAAGEVGQQATSDQAANAAAAAVQPQQSNVVIIIRINSPGDDVVSQTNVISVVAVGANQSSTAQSSGPPTACTTPSAKITVPSSYLLPSPSNTVAWRMTVRTPG